MRRTMSRRSPIRITENRLRQIIRNVINESLDNMSERLFTLSYKYGNKREFNNNVIDICKDKFKLIGLNKDIRFMSKMAPMTPHDILGRYLGPMSEYSDVETDFRFRVTTRKVNSSDPGVIEILQLKFECVDLNDVGFIVTLKTNLYLDEQELTCDFLDDA